jgi:hypothetical protein
LSFPAPRQFSRYLRAAGKKTKYGSPLHYELVRLAAIYREMANAVAPPSAFADDCVFEIAGALGSLGKSPAVQQSPPAPLSEQQENMPLSGGRGVKPPRSTALP